MSADEFDPTLGMPELEALQALEARRAMASKKLAGLGDDSLDIVKSTWGGVVDQLSGHIDDLAQSAALQDTIATVASQAGSTVIRALEEVRELEQFVGEEQAATVRAGIAGELGQIPAVTVAKEFFERYGAHTESAARFLQALGGVPLARTAEVVEVPGAAGDAREREAPEPGNGVAPAAQGESAVAAEPDPDVLTEGKNAKPSAPATAEAGETVKPDLEVIAGDDGIVINGTFVSKKQLGARRGKDKVAFIKAVMDLSPKSRVQPKDLHRVLFGKRPYTPKAKSYLYRIRKEVNDIFMKATDMKLLIGDGEVGRGAQSLRNIEFKDVAFVDRSGENLKPKVDSGKVPDPRKDKPAQGRAATPEGREAAKRTLRPVLHTTGLKFSRKGKDILYSYNKKPDPPLKDVKMRLHALALIGTRGSITGSELWDLVTNLDGTKVSDNERTKCANWLRTYLTYDRENLVSHNGAHGPYSVYSFAAKFEWGGFGFGADLAENSPIRRIVQQIESEIQAAKHEPGVARDRRAAALAGVVEGRAETDRLPNAGDVYVFVSHLAKFNFLLRRRGWPTIGEGITATWEHHAPADYDPGSYSVATRNTRANAAEKILPLLQDDDALLDLIVEVCGDSDDCLKIVEVLSEFSHPAAINMLSVLSVSRVMHREGETLIENSEGVVFWPPKRSKASYMVPSRGELQAPPPIEDELAEDPAEVAAEKRLPENLQNLQRFIRTAAREFAFGPDPKDMDAIGLDPQGTYNLATIEQQMNRFNTRAVRTVLQRVGGSHRVGRRRGSLELGDASIHSREFGLEEVIQVLVLKHEQHLNTLKISGNDKKFGRMLAEEIKKVKATYQKRLAQLETVQYS